MTFHAKTTIIFGFAFIQAALQLLMFMHLTEGKDGRLQSAKVIFAIIITLITVIGTYWLCKVDILVTYNSISTFLKSLYEFLTCTGFCFVYINYFFVYDRYKKK